MSRPARLPRTAVIACGALAADVRRIADRRGWRLDCHPVDALLHNRPDQIPGAVGQAIARLRPRYERLVVAYADCGTHGALGALLEERQVRCLEGLHCYDVLSSGIAGEELRRHPGTYLLSDFLARSFRRTVWRELGLDRHPELCELYFRHYTRVLWLSQRPTAATRARAIEAAALLGLPLQERHVGERALEAALERLLAG